MHSNNVKSATKTVLLSGFLACPIMLSTVLAQSPAASTNSSPPTTARRRLARTPWHYQPYRFPRRASMYYGLVWGVDSLNVRAVESGEIIRFSYRVLDPRKAATLNDKQAEPVLIDAQAGVKLVVPSLEKVGKLR